MLTPDEIERYKRQLVLKEIGGEGQQKLKAAPLPRNGHGWDGAKEEVNEANQYGRVGEGEGDRLSFFPRRGWDGMGLPSRWEKSLGRKGQKDREHASGDQRIDEALSYRHRFDGQQRNDGGGDEERRHHAGRLAAGEQEKGEERHQGDDEKQDERAIDKNLGDQHRENAGAHDYGDKGNPLLGAQRVAAGQELNGKHGGQEGKVPAEHLAEREPHGGGKSNPEGQLMGFADFFGLCRYGNGRR